MVCLLCRLLLILVVIGVFWFGWWVGRVYVCGLVVCFICSSWKWLLMLWLCRWDCVCSVCLVVYCWCGDVVVEYG